MSKTSKHHVLFKGEYMPRKILTIISFCLSTLLFFHNPVQAQILTLTQGMSGDDVYLLQIRLTEYGFYSGEIDKSFGPNTRSAVIRFQLACNLEPDGIVGTQTISALHQFGNRTSVSRGQISRWKGNDIGLLAQRFLEVPYQWAGYSPSGFDCSGFIYYIFNQYGLSIPRTADKQFQVGMAVDKSELQVGDLVFFSTYEPGPSHVGIFIGNDQFIHASSAAEKVTITALSKPYYQSRYLGARRII
jgi:cell wall-associated NlpC family hydrolase